MLLCCNVSLSFVLIVVCAFIGYSLLSFLFLMSFCSRPLLCQLIFFPLFPLPTSPFLPHSLFSLFPSLYCSSSFLTHSSLHFILQDIPSYLSYPPTSYSNSLCQRLYCIPAKFLPPLLSPTLSLPAKSVLSFFLQSSLLPLFFLLFSSFSFSPHLFLSCIPYSLPSSPFPYFVFPPLICSISQNPFFPTSSHLTFLHSSFLSSFSFFLSDIIFLCKSF